MDRDYLIIISGLPRSGTSLLMQILYAGGIPLLYDSERTPDRYNPNGYFEYSKIKMLTAHSDTSWLYLYKGYAVKIVSPILSKLEIRFPARIIFVRRSIDEIIQSQQKMLIGNKIELSKQPTNDELYHIYKKHTELTLDLLRLNPCLKVLEVQFSNLFSKTNNSIKEIARFLDNGLDIEKMESVINPELYRCKL